MRLIDRTAPGQLAINYMWLPTFIGMNSQLLSELESNLTAHVVGKPLTEELLDSAHSELLDLLVKKFPNQTGLFEYLDGIKFVE